MWRRWVADIHLWLSLVVGLQVLAWVVSGLFMSVPAIERVRSEHRMAAPVAADLASEAPFAAPESVLVAAGAPVRRIGLERVGGIMVYNISNPQAPQFVQYINNRDFSGDPALGTSGDLAPEGLVFVSAKQSPSGKPLLIVGNEVSGTTTVYEIDVIEL
jgi:hypothetical protein